MGLAVTFGADVVMDEFACGSTSVLREARYQGAGAKQERALFP
jgi:hypothetical protein